MASDGRASVKRWLHRAFGRLGSRPGDASTTGGGSDDGFRRAVALQQAGDLSAAGDCCEALLRERPEHLDALQLSGAIAFQQGRLDAALSRFEAARRVNSANASVHLNLGTVLHALGRPADAEDAFRSAERLQPGWPPALRSLGALALARGAADEAVRCFLEAQAHDPQDAETALGLARATVAAGRMDEAVRVLRDLVAREPAHAEARFHLGNALRDIGAEAAAESAFREAEALRPDLAEAANNLGALLMARGDAAGAEAAFRRALHARPTFAQARFNLAHALIALRRFDEAEQACGEVLASDPASAEAVVALALVRKARGDAKGARSLLEDLRASGRDTPAAIVNLGVLLAADGDVAAAERCYRDALVRAPANATALYNLGVSRLMQGDYAEGFRLYEHRFDCFAGDSAALGLHRRLDPRQRWRGEPLAGRRILVWTEQGLGDALMTMRFLPRLRGLGAVKVTVQCQPALARVIASLEGVDDVRCEAEAPPADAFDVHAPIMSLPHLFGVRQADLPGTCPCLVPPRAAVDGWRARLRGGVLNVGLAWAGSAALRDDARRSIPLATLAPLLALDGVRCVSLQKDEGRDQRGAFAESLDDWMDECHDLMDTAALVAALDVVISVDTAVAHLAGALGTPVWLLNRSGSEWRWGREGTTTPWYPSMRIFRQEARDDWCGVMRQLHASLEARRDDRRSGAP